MILNLYVTIFRTRTTCTLNLFSKDCLSFCTKIPTSSSTDACVNSQSMYLNRPTKGVGVSGRFFKGRHAFRGGGQKAEFHTRLLRSTKSGGRSEGQISKRLLRQADNFVGN